MDKLLADWLLFCGLTEEPGEERGETLCNASLSIQKSNNRGVTNYKNIQHPLIHAETREHLLLLPTVTFTGIGMGTVGYSSFTSVSAGY